jgi:glucokinase-like ROK family protein
MISQINQLKLDDVKPQFNPIRMNFSCAEAAVLDHIRKHRALTKSDLVELTDFSRSKIAGCVNSLLEKEMLTKDGFGDNTGGRRSILYTFNGKKGLLFGADIGATSIDLIITDLNRKVLARYAESALVSEGPIKILDRINDLFNDLLVQFDLTKHSILALGIGVPGPVNFKEGMVVSPPIMPGWDQFPIIDYLQGSWPETNIIVDNDVNIMALGEYSKRENKDRKKMIFIKIGSGIGAGIILDGEIYRGSSGCAGDVGHICVDKNGPICPCGNRGCLEVMAGGIAIAERAMSAAKEGQSTILKKYLDKNDGILSAIDVGLAAKEGDETSIEIIRDSGRIIGEVLAVMVNIYNPGMIVIGGGVSKLGNLLLSSIRQAVLKRSLPLATKDLPIVFSPILEDAGVIGAMNLALDQLIKCQMREP